MIRVGSRLHEASTLCRLNANISPVLRRHASKTTTTTSPATPSDVRSKSSLSPPARAVVYVLAALLTAHITFGYVIEYNGCQGISMMPTFNSYGDAVLISKYYRRGRGVQVGDLVSFAHPIYSDQRAIKRVIGLEGDFVLRDTPGIGGTLLQVPQGHCWLVGDNLTFSRDSRMFGPLPLALIKGKVIRRFSPWYRSHKLQTGLQSHEADDNLD